MKRNSAAIGRRLEREHHARDLTDDPATMSSNTLSSAIYRLQSHHDPQYLPRIRELLAETQRRHNEKKSA